MRRFLLLLLVSTAALLGGCGYNDFQRLDEESRSAWAEVLNQYQRRADLIPNIVATVQGEANFDPGHARAAQRPGGPAEIPGRPG
jgi:LemA protein